MSNAFADLLGRRLSFPATYSSALRISPDGRIALSIGDSVSIVYSRAALQAPTFDPVSFQELLDETQRKARGVRTPAVSHVLVDDQPARALAWTCPSVLLVAPSASNGTLRRLVPPFSICTGYTGQLEGSWGLSSTLWQVINGCSLEVLCNHHEVTKMSNSNLKTCELQNSSDCTDKRKSPRKRKQRRVLDLDSDDSDGPRSNRSRVLKKEEEEYSPTPDMIVETKREVDDDNITLEKDTIQDDPLIQPQATGDYSRLITVNSFSSDREASGILSLSVFNLNAANEKGLGLLKSDNSARTVTFVAFGFRDGVVVRRWNGKDSPMGREYRVWDEWTSCLESMESIDMLNSPGAILAVGGSSGNVRVFSVVWVPSVDNDEFVKVIPVWNGADSVLRGPVVSFSFRIPSLAPYRFLLAIGVGNSVAGVRIDEIDDGGRKVFRARVSLAYDAHYHSVSSVCFLPDESVLSSSKDGSISRWKFEWEENTEPCTPLGVVQQPSPDLDSVVAMRSTPSCLLLATLTTRPTVKGEIGEPAPVVKKKYHYLGRPTLLSILAYPIDLNDTEKLRESLENSMTNIIERSKYADVPLSLWDVELWLLANKQHIEAAQVILIEKYELVRSRIKDAKWQSAKTRLRKVAHSIATVLSRCEVEFGNRPEQIQDSKSKLSHSILVDYHFSTLSRFSQLINCDIGSTLAEIECESLEAKLNFVMSHIELLEEQSDVNAVVQEIGTKLANYFQEKMTTRTTRKYLICDICCEDVPLVACTNDPMIFRCANGDSYSRCVVTGLPVTDCVPRSCSGCGQRARVDIVQQLYPWSPNPLVCPICNCELLQGRAEISRN